MIRKILFGTLVLGTTVKSLQGAVELTMDEMKVIEVRVAKEGLTRIAVKSDRISNVYGIAGEFLMEPDEDQGQIFIRPRRQETEQPFHLTLTTEEGRTQDLRLVPQESAPEAIVLTPQAAPALQISKSASMSREEIVELMNACREGNVPSGYHIRVVDLQEQTGPHLIIREIRNDRLVAQTLEIINPHKGILYLNPQDYGRFSGTVAVSLSRKALKPGERGEIYVVKAIQ